MKPLKEKAESQPSASSVRFPFKRTNGLLLGVLALTFIQFLISPPVSQRLAAMFHASPKTNAPTQLCRSQTPPKPWGDLESDAIVLEVPDEYLSSSRFSAEKLAWFFPSAAHSQFLNRLGSFDLTEAQRSLLGDAAKWRTTTNGFYFSPDREFLIELTTQARQQIYPMLAPFPENIYQNSPFRFHPQEVDQWFANSGLYSATVSLLKRLLYRRGESMCFSDMAVFSSLPLDEYKRVLKSLTRVRAVVMRLRISPETDVNALVGYWGKRETTERIKPLLESLAKTKTGATLDVVHLLPAFARNRLYSFPDRSDTEACARQNCFWTAMNFFSEKPDDRFSDPKYIKEVLHRDYTRIQAEPTFGDLIALQDSHGSYVHWSVYIADDVVFTKNGGYILQPWTLMKTPDMLAKYSSEEPLKQVIFRAKSLP